MKFIDDIFSFVWDISNWFYNLYLNVPDYAWLTDWIKAPLLFISDLFWKLLTPIAQFGVWVDDVADKVTNIFTKEEGVELTDYAKNILAKQLEEQEKGIIEITDYAKNILAMDIKEMAKRLGLTEDEFRDFLRPKLDSLEVSIGSLDTSLAEEINNLKQTQVGLETVGRTVTEHSNWIAVFNDVKSNVVDFITAPFDWLWEQFTDWFLGKE